MALTEKLKILDNNIKANQAQYDLDRQAGKISALSSGDLDKHEYFTGEDLGYKPSVAEQGKFDYCPLSKVFNKALDEKDKKGVLLKRLKNIENKNEDQLKMIKDKVGIKWITNFVEKSLSQEEIAFINEIKSIDKNVKYTKLYFRGGNGVLHDLNNYKTFKELFREVFKNISIDETERKQDKFWGDLDNLKKYDASMSKYVELKENVLKNAKKKNYDGKEEIIKRFKNIFFPLFKENGMETDSGNQQPDIADTSDLKNKEPKLKSAESIAEKTTIKRQKESDDKQSDTPEHSKNFIDFLNQIKKEQHNISMSLYKKFFFFLQNTWRNGTNFIQFKK